MPATHVLNEEEGTIWCPTTNPVKVMSQAEFEVLRAQGTQAMSDVCQRCLAAIQAKTPPSLQIPNTHPGHNFYFLSDEAYNELVLTPRRVSVSIPCIAFNPNSYVLNLPDWLQQDLAERAPWPIRIRDFEHFRRKRRFLTMSDATESNLAGIITRLKIPHRNPSRRARAGLALELILIGWLKRE